jgi:hypothetical protein
MPRNLPEEFFNNRTFQRFMNNVASDPELFPEIRDGSLTVYYRGDALIRDLRVMDGQILGQVHFKYIPVQSPDKYVTLQLRDTGLLVPPGVAPMSIGLGDSNVLKEYKRVMKSVRRGLEAPIVHQIVCNSENVVLDQEIKFQTPGEDGGDKIDIVHFDTHLNCLAFVEVKGIHDLRLAPRPDELPKVVDQLRRYGRRINDQRDAILGDYNKVITLKQRLGLGARLNKIPTDGLKSLLKKPLLVIGNCCGNVVDSIVNREREWVPLMDGLERHAAGLILCGTAGCRLSLTGGRQVIVFDTDSYSI